MPREYWTITEIIEHFQIDRDFLKDLETEEIICPICREDSEEKLIPSSEMEKLRLAKVLFEEMDVNVAGIEVILQMRENMLNMRRQFDAILEDISRRFRWISY